MIHVTGADARLQAPARESPAPASYRGAGALCGYLERRQGPLSRRWRSSSCNCLIFTFLPPLPLRTSVRSTSAPNAVPPSAEVTSTELCKPKPGSCSGPAPRSKLRQSMCPTLPNEKELITHLPRKPLELFVSRTLRGFGPLEQHVTRPILPTRGTSKDFAMGKNRFPNDFFPRIVRR